MAKVLPRVVDATSDSTLRAQEQKIDAFELEKARLVETRSLQARPRGSLIEKNQNALPNPSQTLASC